MTSLPVRLASLGFFLCAGCSDTDVETGSSGVVIVEEPGIVPTPSNDQLADVIDEKEAFPGRPETVEVDMSAELSDEALTSTQDANATQTDSLTNSVDLGVPPVVSVEVSSLGGELETGSYRAVVPPFAEPTTVILTPLSVASIREPRPPSVPLAAAQLEPVYYIADEMFEVTMPLDGSVPEGTVVQMLVYSRSMRGFAVADVRTVSEDRVVTFRTDVFSQYVVIAAPELAETTCVGNPFSLHERFPNSDERAVVGNVPLDMRIPREVALSVLADMRYFPGAENIVFKDEDVIRNTPTHRYDGEDFLVDPRLAAPIMRLGTFVQQQWIDPMGGGPAFELRVTDAYDSLIEHSETSNHYRGQAVDITLSPVPGGGTRQRDYGRLARLASCSGFDFVDYEDRFHVHVSSAPTRLAYFEESAAGQAVVVTTLDGASPIRFDDSNGLNLDEHDVRSLTFNQDGSAIVLYAREKGAPRAYEIQLDTSQVTAIAESDIQPRLYEPPILNPSLSISAKGGSIWVTRPLFDRADYWFTDVVQSEPFALTEDGVHGTLPAVWTLPWPDGDWTNTDDD